MDGADSSAPPGPGKPERKRKAVVLQVKLACATLDAVKSRYADLREKRFVLRTRQHWPLETLVRLETKLSTGEHCFHAAALVESVNPVGDGLVSMTLSVVAMDEGGRELVAWMGGQPPRPLRESADGPARANEGDPQRVAPTFAAPVGQAASEAARPAATETFAMPPLAATRAPEPRPSAQGATRTFAAPPAPRPPGPAPSVPPPAMAAIPAPSRPAVGKPSSPHPSAPPRPSIAIPTAPSIAVPPAPRPSIAIPAVPASAPPPAPRPSTAAPSAPSPAIAASPPPRPSIAVPSAPAPAAAPPARPSIAAPAPAPAPISSPPSMPSAAAPPHAPAPASFPGAGGLPASGAAAAAPEPLDWDAPPPPAAPLAAGWPPAAAPLPTPDWPPPPSWEETGPAPASAASPFDAPAAAASPFAAPAAPTSPFAAPPAPAPAAAPAAPASPANPAVGSSAPSLWDELPPAAPAPAAATQPAHPSREPEVVEAQDVDLDSLEADLPAPLPASPPKAAAPQPPQTAPPPPRAAPPAAPGAPAPVRTSPAIPAVPPEPPPSRRPAPPPLPRPTLARGPADSGAPVLVDDAVPAAPAPATRKGRIIGIDLGTTNSAAAVVKEGKPFIIPSREGYNTIPSVVALNEKGNVIVGHQAKGQLLINPRNTVYGFKRLVGRQFKSPVVSDLVGRFSYEIATGLRGEASVKLGDKIYSLQKISSMVLSDLKELAERWLGEPVTRAVITVPAYYNDNQRQAVRAAGALAGLEVERILNEPTAAAIAFAHGRSLEERVLVYDLGGGTFDTSVLQLHGSVYEVISTGGDTFLGGVDFDKELVNELLERFKRKHGIDFNGDRVAYQRINDAAERAKIALSERLSAPVKVPFVSMVGDKAYDVDETITRVELEKLCAELVERTLRVCDDVLTNCGLKPSDIGEVLLVGGQSRMPLVRSRIREFFGKEPSKAVHPDEAVALGASLLANSVQTGEIGGMVLMDVLPMSIGVGMPGGRFNKIVERNTSLPHRKVHSVWTSEDQQKMLEIPIFQGESDKAQDNEYLGTLVVADLPPGSKGNVVFDIIFNISAESILTVTAEERGTARSVTATFSTQDTPESVRRRLAVPPPMGKPEFEQLGEGAKGSGLMGWLKRKLE